ncbi:MAG: 2-oxoacid:acceptor oxidoreductase family protein [Candidatus Omnitrophota bacterium]
MNILNETIICAGFGGQGIMVLGKVLANAGMDKGLHVTWMPSYGAEVRGGTAHSDVRLSSSPIASPLISQADTVIAMNTPSLDKFEERLVPGGLLIINTSLVRRASFRKDIKVVRLSLTDEAIKLGNVRVANMIAVGAFEAIKKIFGKNILMNVMKRMAAGREEILPANIKALEMGMQTGMSGNV